MPQTSITGLKIAPVRDPYIVDAKGKDPNINIAKLYQRLEKLSKIVAELALLQDPTLNLISLTSKNSLFLGEKK